MASVEELLEKLAEKERGDLRYEFDHEMGKVIVLFFGAVLLVWFALGFPGC